MTQLRNISIALFVFLALAYPQENTWSVDLRLGKPDYNMTGLRRLQSNLLRDYQAEGIPVAVVDDFPSNYLTRVVLSKAIDSVQTIGVFWDQTSTGGKIHYSDYSGELSNVMMVSRNSLGIQTDWIVIAIRGLSFHASLGALAILSALDIESNLQVWDESLEEVYSFETIGFAVEPGVGLQLGFQGLKLQIRASYLLAFSKAFHESGNQDAILYSGYDKPAKPDWGGPQLTLTIASFAWGRR